MSTNINNTINKFDNKYLKCVVSKYSSVLNYLSNSGALIILQPQSDTEKYYKDLTHSYNRNYIYLGNEFLASGYGFLCKTMRDDAETIVRNYNIDITALKNADSKERLERIGEDKNIRNELKTFIKYNGGGIEKTNITIDGVTIPTKDIILYGEEAQYENLKVEKINIYVTTHTGVTYKAVNNNVILPIGSTIKQIKVEITTNDGDSGGVEKIQILHKIKYAKIQNSHISYDDTINEGIIVDYEQDDESPEIIKDAINDRYNLHKYIYIKNFGEDENFIVNNNVLYDVIKSIYLYVKETPIDKYKNYPGLAIRGYNVVSSGNAIKPNKIDLSLSLNIIPQYYITWAVTAQETNFNVIQHVPINNFSKLNIYTENIETTVDIPIDSKTTNITNNTITLYFLLPLCFTLKNIYLVKFNKVEDDLQNCIIKENYNSTGATTIYSSNLKIPCPNTYKSTDNTCLTMNYNMYKITFKRENLNYVELNIIYNKTINSDINDSSVFKNLVTDNNTNAQTVHILLNNEEFNSMYWINGKQTLTTRELQDKLNLVKNNY